MGRAGDKGMGKMNAEGRRDGGRGRGGEADEGVSLYGWGRRERRGATTGGREAWYARGEALKLRRGGGGGDVRMASI